VRQDNRKLLDGLFEGLSWAKLRYTHSGYLDQVSGARVSGGTSGALFDREDAETGNRNLITFLECVHNRVDHGVHRLFGRDFCSTQNTVHYFYNALLVHNFTDVTFVTNGSTMSLFQNLPSIKSINMYEGAFLDCAAVAASGVLKNDFFSVAVF